MFLINREIQGRYETVATHESREAAQRDLYYMAELLSTPDTRVEFSEGVMSVRVMDNQTPVTYYRIQGPGHPDFDPVSVTFMTGDGATAQTYTMMTSPTTAHAIERGLEQFAYDYDLDEFELLFTAPTAINGHSLHDFYEYCESYYGPGGIYPLAKNGQRLGGPTLHEAINLYLKEVEEFAADTLDRENVRDILIDRLGYNYASEQTTTATATAAE